MYIEQESIMSNDFVAPEAPVVTSEAEIQIPSQAPVTRGGGGGGGSRIQIVTPQGQKVDRAAYIRKLVAAGWDRGQITKHLRDECGDASIRYQTVYGLTKNDFPKRAEKSGTGAVKQTAIEAPIVTAEEDQVEL
jgi:hypothetical protein